MPIMGYVRIDPRMHKKLERLAEKYDLVLRDLVNFILEETEEHHPAMAKELDRLIKEGEEEAP